MKSILLYCLLLSSILSCTSSTSETDAPANSVDVALREGTNLAIALSPDYSTFAIDLQGTIWLLPVEGGMAQPITDALGDCHEPAWSPDGQQIAFHSYRDGNYHIWIINRDGTQLKQLTFGRYDHREPHWSPDGQHIVFSSDRNGNYNLWEIALASGEVTALTENPANEYHPVYSPDGSQIAYVSGQADAPGIYSLNSETGTSERLVASKAKLASPSWSPDQQQISFLQYSEGEGHLAVFSLTASDSAQVQTVDEDVFPFRSAWQSDSSFFYTSDGKIKQRIVGQEGASTVSFEATVTLSRPSYARKIYDLDDTTARPALGMMTPVVSPNGQSVAFAALGDIWIQSIANETLKA
ncbi:MAG: DPP IV N-terminal domain-containing protein, partial [Bacteroidota bacterium]